MSVRLKISIIVIGFFSLIVAAFAVYSVDTTGNYRQLRTEEVLKTVAFESERVRRVIAEMERNAVDLALAGRQFYFASKHSEELGISVSVENFSAFTSAVGGGIWFEPYVLDPGKRRECYYAFFDKGTNAVRHDPDFESEEYDYHTQMWYKTIAAGLKGKYGTVWTKPYYDDVGTNALMTTVGAGIYNDSGRFMGMSTVDWGIQSMVDRLAAIKPTEGSFVLLVSTKGDYVVSNTYGHANSDATSIKALPWNIEDDSFVLDGVKYIAFRSAMDNGWLFSVQIPAKEIFAEIETRNNQFSIIIAVSFFTLLALTAYLLQRLINRPLRRLTLGVAELGSGNLDKQIAIHSKDEFGTLAAAFNKMTVDLKASIEQSAQERAEKERIGAELDVATKIQASMLPCIFPAFPHRAEFDIYAVMHPAKEVGGDFYDFFLIDEHTLAVVIADVSGKGVPAALFMVIAKTLIKNNAQNGKNPKEVFEMVNNLLCEGNDEHMFVTAFLGYLNIPSGRFTFVSAGHNPPFARLGGHFEELKVKNGLVFAVMKNMEYEQAEITLQKDDELFLYTDGVTEAMNLKKELFGDARLTEIINSSTNLPLDKFISSIEREIDKFAEGAGQADDITMLALRYTMEGVKY